MIKVIGGRSTGKTNRLFSAAFDYNMPVICRNPKHFEKKALAYGFTGITFISYAEAEEFLKTYGDDVLVDELEDYVKYITNDRLGGYTLTED